MGEFVRGLVSIVTPVYNGESHITRYLEAVLSQDYTLVELILVDDGSSDGTVSVAREYEDKFAKRGYGFRLVEVEHSSAAGAVSAGLKFVRGEFLIWPDSDDVIAPQSISKRVTFLEENPKYGAVRSLMKYVSEADGSECAADERVGDINNTHLFWDILFSRTYVCCGCYMLRSELFFDIYKDKKIPLYDVGQNFQMLLPFMYNYECATIEDVLYTVYKRTGSHSRRVLSREQDEKKYADYELMIDELALIAGIHEKTELKQIEFWILDRRVKLAERYNDRLGKVRALCAMKKAGLIGTCECVKKIIGTLGGSRVKRAIKKIIKV